MAQSVAEYLDRAIEGFERDPADTDLQRGYLEALKAVRAEAFPAARDDDFAAIRDTAHGQLLMYLDTDDDDKPSIRVVGAEVRDVRPAAVLSYDDEESRRRNFAKMLADDCEDFAARLHATAEKFAPKVSA